MLNQRIVRSLSFLVIFPARKKKKHTELGGFGIKQLRTKDDIIRTKGVNYSFSKLKLSYPLNIFIIFQKLR